MKKGQKTLIGYVTSAEVVKRTWIVTITGDETGSSPAAIKQGIYNVAMELAGKIPGAHRVAVGLAHTGRGAGEPRQNRGRPRKAPPTVAVTTDAEAKRLRKNELQRKARARKLGEPGAGTRRRVDPAKVVTAQEAYVIYKKSNGQLTPPQRLVISHLMGWDVERMDKRSIGRQFSIGGEQKVKEIARQGWEALGLTRIKNAFEAK